MNIDPKTGRVLAAKYAVTAEAAIMKLLARAVVGGDKPGVTEGIRIAKLAESCSTQDMRNMVAELHRAGIRLVEILPEYDKRHIVPLNEVCGPAHSINLPEKSHKFYDKLQILIDQNHTDVAETESSFDSGIDQLIAAVQSGNASVASTDYAIRSTTGKPSNKILIPADFFSNKEKLIEVAEHIWNIYHCLRNSGHGDYQFIPKDPYIGVKILYPSTKENTGVEDGIDATVVFTGGTDLFSSQIRNGAFSPRTKYFAGLGRLRLEYDPKRKLFIPIIDVPVGEGTAGYMKYHETALKCLQDFALGKQIQPIENSKYGADEIMTAVSECQRIFSTDTGLHVKGVRFPMYQELGEPYALTTSGITALEPPKTNMRMKAGGGFLGYSNGRSSNVFMYVTRVIGDLFGGDQRFETFKGVVRSRFADKSAVFLDSGAMEDLPPEFAFLRSLQRPFDTITRYYQQQFTTK
jgi:hypothetical protein